MAELRLPEAAAALVPAMRGRKRGRPAAAQQPEVPASPTTSANPATDTELPPHEESESEEEELVPAAVQAQAMRPNAPDEHERNGSRCRAGGGTRSGVHAQKAQGGQQATGAAMSTRGGGAITRAGSRQQTSAARGQGT